MIDLCLDLYHLCIDLFINNVVVSWIIHNSGWIGICIGQLVPWFQIAQLYKSKKSKDVSTGTYVALITALSFYWIHAVDIRDPAFITAQSLALFSNSVALILK